MSDAKTKASDECWSACYNDGDVDRVRELLDNGVDINALAPCSGGAPLDAAIGGGHLPLVRFLVQRGADVNGVGYGSYTALMMAANQMSTEATQILLDHGADPNLPSPTTGETPLHAVCAKAFGERANDVLDILLAAGANPNTKAKNGVATSTYYRDIRVVGETPLHLAAAYGDHAMIKALIDAGADPTLRDDRGDSPLTWYSRHQRCVSHHKLVRRDVAPLLEYE